MNQSQSNQPLAAPGAKRRIERLVADGRTSQEIADAFGVSLSTFAGWKRHYGLTQPRKKALINQPGAIDMFERMLANGKTIGECAANFGVPIHTIESWIFTGQPDEPSPGGQERECSEDGLGIKDDATREKLKKLIDAGKSDAECAAEFGVSRQSIGNWRRRWGMTRVRQVHDPKVKAKLEQLLRAGKTVDECAEVFEVSRGTIDAWKKRWGMSVPNAIREPGMRERLKALVDKGRTNEECAVELGVSETTISAWKKRWGMSVPKAIREPGMRERLEALVAEGKTNAECAERLGVSLNTLIKWKRRWGLVKSKSKPTVVADPRVRERLAELLVEGKTGADCAAIIGVSEPTISRWRHKWGLTMPRRAAS